MAVACAAYYPGLSGGFLFDDAANLPALGAYGRIHELDGLLRYLTSGRADPTGRPLSLLSFLLDARNWPADPAPFKRTNLLIHLVNGALLFTFLLRFGALHGLPRKRALLAASVAAGAWLLHPLFVSTVLYVVQREAMLPATVTLLALNTWLYARRRMLNGAPGGTAALVIGVPLLTVVAFLCKPNGGLVALLILVAEACSPMLPSTDSVRRYRRALYLAAWPFAALAIGGVVLVAVRSIGHGTVPGRTFSILQRVMTEPAILLEYLRLLALLDPQYGSLFHEQYLPATSLFSPWWTLPAILIVVAAGLFGWRVRKRHPAVALAIGFFLAGHLIESSSLALELYFEHRNYLPAMMLFWPLGLALGKVKQATVRNVAAGGCLAALALMTHTTARLWGDPLAQAEVWAAESPGSPRAQVYAARLEAGAGLWQLALPRIDRAAEAFSGEPQAAMARIDLHCTLGRIPSGAWLRLGNALRTTARDPGPLLSQWVAGAIGTSNAHTCPDFDLSRLRETVDAAAANPAINHLPGRMQDIDHLRGLFALQEDDTKAALTWFNSALAHDPRTDVALQQASLLGSAKHPRAALAHLDYFNTLEVPLVRPTQGMAWLHARLLDRQGYWPGELSRVRSLLDHEARGDLH
jgi:hypothetical protein